MKSKLILAFLVLLGLSLALTGCNRHAEEKAALQSKLEQLQATLKQTQAERDAVKDDATRLSESLKKAKSELVSVTQARNKLQQQLNELANSRDALQKQVGELTKSRDSLQALANSRDELQRQVGELTSSRDAALADARNAQAKVQELTTRLQKQAQEVGQLQGQIKTIRAAIEELQNKLK